MSVKINQLEIENVKRIKAVKIELTENGLNVIGGKNGQGKTSVLDSIAWCLGGDRYKPSKAQREGSVANPHLKVTLSNGLIVERKGKNSALKVVDPEGNKSGQQVLNSFIEELAINLPKFMNSTSQEKARTLLQIIGVGEQLYALEKKEKELYSERLQTGRIADQKKKYADEQVFYKEAPNELISPSELIAQQQAILAKNGENQRKRMALDSIKQSIMFAEQDLIRAQEEYHKKQEYLEKLKNDLSIAEKDAIDLHDESTAELEENIRNIDEINRKVRANLDKEKAEEEAIAYKKKYDDLTTHIEAVRQEKIDLLTNANLPLPELSVEDGEITYKGQKWDNMSGAEQLKVSTAIVRKLNPDCGFILLDKLEQMDQETLKEFGQWLEEQGLQAIGTRVSTGDECSIIIEDGCVVKDEQYQTTEDIPVEIEAPKTWEAGKF